MTVTIFPEYTPTGTQEGYRARLQGHEARGKTVGEALDALEEMSATWEEGENALSGTLVLIQRFRPDAFFTAEQQERLKTLMARWREAEAGKESLPQVEREELEVLVLAEQQGMLRRTQALLESQIK
jgi:hypothetical protein